jgi:cellulose synthase/poly-beta-1,6-N-acetylglucosamine synthase-like glycosyltransferase
MVILIVTVLLLAGYGLLIHYYYYHWKKLPLFQLDNELPQTFISVIVAARNEEKTLPLLLQALQQQTYPAHLFEAIVVDDFSTDGTRAAVPILSKPHIKVIQPQTDPLHSSKKKAIEAGVKEAKGELLVITDADCLPQKEWLSIMAHCYQQKGSAFIAAPVRFTHDSSLLQLFQSIDFITLQGITAASVAAGFHSMCNGANLAYTKEAFVSVNGFEGIDKVASGDDMLLMHKIKKLNPQKVHYLKHPNAIVTTPPMSTWKQFVMQRRRWASKTTYYDDKNVLLVLLFIYVFNCWFLVLLVAAFFQPVHWFTLLGYGVLKTLVEWRFVQSVASFYGEPTLMRYFPLLQPLHILYTISVGFISQLGAYEWKGRRTK